MLAVNFGPLICASVSIIFLPWQARQDSNLRVRESKSRALPLGDAP